MGIKLRQFTHTHMTWSKRECYKWKWKVHDLYTKSLIRSKTESKSETYKELLHRPSATNQSNVYTIPEVKMEYKRSDTSMEHSTSRMYVDYSESPSLSASLNDLRTTCRVGNNHDVNAPTSQPKWVPSGHDLEANSVLGRKSKHVWSDSKETWILKAWK